jgi:hypothetical protein
MRLTGEERIRAKREAVWRALHDTEVLGRCLPGCETIEQTGDGGFQAAAAVRVGPVKARFTGTLAIRDPDPPNGYRIDGEAKGGAAGFARGTALVRLAEDGGETVLRYEVDATIGGRLAQIGSRLVDVAARQMADAFFAGLAGELAPATATPTEPAAKPPVWVRLRICPLCLALALGVLAALLVVVGWLLLG